MTDNIGPQGESDARGLMQAWVNAMVSTEPSPRGLVEEAVHRLYRSVGLQSPDVIRWTRGPLELTADREERWLWQIVGENVLPLVTDKLSDANCSYSDAARSDPLSKRRAALVRTSESLHNALGEILERELAHKVPRHSLRRFFLRFMGRRRPTHWFSMTVGGRSQFNSPWFNCESHLYSRYGLFPNLIETLTALSTIVANVGWIVPHENVCWLCERPEILRIDGGVRLHAADGPALRYRDGLEIHVWKGVVVPAWLVQQPETITVGRIAREWNPIVRRCMIDIMTPARFIAASGARIASRDQTGTLWTFTSGLDTWAAVEVVNGTPEPDGTNKHYFLQVPAEMRSARQAVAWTYGLSEAEYAQLSVRT